MADGRAAGGETSSEIRSATGIAKLSAGDLIVMGPPGVGKGTQAKALAQENGWVQLSTGELFRDHIRRETDLGRRVKTYLDQGLYVPDEVTVDMVRERVRDISPSTRVLFDGFPRTVAQAEQLDRLLEELGRRVDAVLLLDAPREELLARLSSRAITQSRTDDTPEVIAKRLDLYHGETSPVISYYDDRGVVKRVDGVGTVAEVTRRLREAVD